MNTKTTKLLDFKATDEGQVEAVFATLNVVDHDGDVTVPGAFEDGQKVLISAYGHSSWDGVPPVGKGTISANQEVATLKGQFFMNTTNGRDTFNVVKEIGDQGEWSYGFDTLQADFGTFEDKQVQFLRKLDVHEVSPVLKGAGINTQTLSVKSLKDLTDEQLMNQAIEVCEALKAKGLPVPANLAEMVRDADRSEATVNRDREELLAIAALYGDIEEGS